MTIEKKEYIVERYQLGTKRQLSNNDRIYSVGRLWNQVADRKYYFHATRFNQRQLDLLAIWLIKRTDKFVSLKKGYSLTQNDCLEFAKDFVSELAELELEQNKSQDILKSKLRSLTIARDSVLASSEFSARNVTAVGLSVGASYNSAGKISDGVENKQRQQQTVANNESRMPWKEIVLSSVITASVLIAFFTKWSK